MTYYVGSMPVGEHLSHHGIKGMKWGQRRYQNPDGSLTAAGRLRYGVSNTYGRARSGASNFYKKHKRAINTAAGVAAVAGAAYLGSRTKAGRKLAAKAAGRIAKSRLSRSAAKSYKTYGVESPYLTSRAKRRIDRRSSSKVLGGMFDSASRSARRSRIGAQIDDAFGSAKRVKNRAPWYTNGIEGRIANNVARSEKRAARKKVAGMMRPERVRKTNPDFATSAFDSAVKANRRTRIKSQVNDAIRGGRKANSGVKKSGSDFMTRAMDAGERSGRRARISAQVNDALSKPSVRGETARQRKKRISKTVRDTFDSPSRYLGTHTNGQIKRDAARRIAAGIASAYAGAGTAAYISRPKKKKKSRR